MVEVIHLKTPLTDKDVEKVKAGDIVYFSGEVWTCRSLFQKKIIDEKLEMPFSTEKRNVLVHMGPIMVRKNEKWIPVSMSPTTSIRFEKWIPDTIKMWGLKAIVGKGTVGSKSRATMKEFNCFHACPIGVYPQKLVSSVVEVVEVHWIDKIGLIEAPWVLLVKDFGPFMVDVDSNGVSYFERVENMVEANKANSYEFLGIPRDFEYILLY